MSASKKELRQQEREARMARRAEQAEKKQMEMAKFRRNTIIVVAAFLVLTVVVVLLSTPVLYGLNAITCGDLRFSTADYNYFYTNTYANYYSTYQSYYGESAQYFMPGPETLSQYTVDAMQDIAVLVTSANAEDFTLSEEKQEVLAAAVENVEISAKLQRMSVGRYLRASYGAGVNMKVFQRCVELSLIAEEYEAMKRDTFQYTADELTAHYAENVDKYDVIGFNAYYFNGTAVEDNAETEEDESVDVETAMAAAKADAEDFLDRLEAGESFAKLTYEFSGENEAYNSETAGYTEVSGENLAEIYAEWLLDASRKEGDATAVEADNGWYVVEFISRNDNTYNTVNVRHILVEPAAVSEDAEDYESELAAAMNEALTEAENLLTAWEDGDATEESFAELADQNSDDAAEGGLYTQVHLGQMVEPFEEWIFDSSRKTGDTDIVESEFGYHVMYFVGTDAPYCDVLAENNLRAAAYDEWFDAQHEAIPVETNLFYSLYIK